MKQGILIFAASIVFIVILNMGCSLLETENKPLPFTEKSVSDISYPKINTREDYVIVDKSENILYFYKKGKFVRRFQVATGRNPLYTPEGVFPVVLKADGSAAPRFKSAQLGMRWIGLAVPPEADNRWEKGKEDDRGMKGLKYGIHGTNVPNSIGKRASGGCIRMDNQDVIDFYGMVQIGTKVEIRP